MTLKQAKSLIVQSKFSEALSLLEDIKKQHSDNALNILEILTLQAIIYRRTRNTSVLPNYENSDILNEQDIGSMIFLSIMTISSCYMLFSKSLIIKFIPWKYY